MAGEATRPLIGRRGVGSEQQEAIYGKRTSQCALGRVTHRPTTTAAEDPKHKQLFTSSCSITRNTIRFLRKEYSIYKLLVQK